jgi:hypothetical protein
MHSPIRWTRTTVATAAAAFGVNTTSGLPTGGLEMPSVVNRAPEQWAPDLAYWDVAQRRLILVQDVLGLVAAPRKLIVASGPSGGGSPGQQPSSSPGCWPRLAPMGGGGLVLAFFDLEQGALLATTCSVGQAVPDLACTAPTKIDSVGHRDVSDFGAGAFPSFGSRLQNSDSGAAAGRRGQVVNSLVYFSQEGAPQRADCAGFAPAADCTGSLKIAEFSSASPSSSSGNATAAISTATIHTLATGKAGFGRDASVAFQQLTQTGGSGSALTAMVSFLDLEGQDELQTMRARLGIFDMASD